MKIKVTQGHINTATPHCGSCPISLAIASEFPIRVVGSVSNPECKDVHLLDMVAIVGDGTVIMGKKNSPINPSTEIRDPIRRILCPEGARRFIEHYDHWATQSSSQYANAETRIVCPEPFEFELEIEDE